MTAFHGRILLEQRDPNPDPERRWQDISTQLAAVELRAGSPLEVLMAMADHLAALIKQSPESAPSLRKQATDVMRIGLSTPPPAPPALPPDVATTAPDFPGGADHPPASGG